MSRIDHRLIRASCCVGRFADLITARSFARADALLGMVWPVHDLRHTAAVVGSPVTVKPSTTARCRAE